MSAYPWLARRKAAGAIYVPPAALVSPGLFGRIGRLLFGQRWHPEMARSLKMSEHNVRFFANGTRPIHAGIASDLAEICDTRAEELGEAAELLRRKA